MSAVEFVSFKLKKGTDTASLLAASDRFNEQFLVKQKGYISRKLLNDGDVWADYVEWDTKENHIAASNAAFKDEAAMGYLSMLNLNSCKMLLMDVKKGYN